MKLTTALAVLFCSLAGSLMAQQFEVSANGGFFRPNRAKLGSLNETARDDDTVLKASPGYGASVSWSPWAYYGFDVGYFQTRPDFETKIRTGSGKSTVDTLKTEKVKTQQAYVNMVAYFMPKREKLRPFVTAGMNAFEWGIPKNIAEFTNEQYRNYGFNFGGGLKYYPARHIVFRLDVKEYYSGKPYDLKFANDQLGGGFIRQVQATAGVGFTFGH